MTFTSPTGRNPDGLPPVSSSDPDVVLPKFFVIGGKLRNLFSHSKISPAKLCMYLPGLEFLTHLVVAVSRSSGAKFFSDEKVRAKMSNI